LAGVNVLYGKVYLRQAAYDSTSHAVQIGIASKSQIIMPSTVQAKPGQYKQQTIQQIGSAAFGSVGVGFNVVGNPSGADLPFARVSEQVGETLYGFVERLCRLRNLHMIDDGKGNVEAFRGPQGQSAALVEGKNILKARLLLDDSEYTEKLQGVAQLYRPISGPAGAQVSATTTVPAPFGGSAGGFNKFIVEDAADALSVRHRVNHQGDQVSYDTVDGIVTVQGWFRAEGDLWYNHVRDNITVNSPMLIPGGSMSFVIKEVIHRQSSADGTTTDIMITNARGLGGEPLYGAGTPTPNAT
jgi:hypothetical protein